MPQVQIKATASSVLIEPISKTKNTYRGRVSSVGSSSCISVNVGDIVYYTEEEILSEMNIPQTVHAMFYYKIFAVEKQDNYIDNLNKSINSTISRTLNTSLTTLVVLLAMFLFGADSLKDLLFALILGVIVGTYSSVFIATPIMYDTAKKGNVAEALKNKVKEEPEEA